MKTEHQQIDPLTPRISCLERDNLLSDRDKIALHAILDTMENKEEEVERLQRAAKKLQRVKEAFLEIER